MYIEWSNSQVDIHFIHQTRNMLSNKLVQIDSSAIEAILDESEMFKQENKVFNDILKFQTFNVDLIKADGPKTLFYTGLKTQHLYLFFSPSMWFNHRC